MKQLKTYLVSIVIIIIAAMAASCGGANVGVAQPEENIDQAAQPLEQMFSADEFPEFPLDEEAAADDSKGASWLGHPNHLTPWFSHLGGIDPGDAGCYLLQGWKPNATTGFVPNPRFAYAIYKIPLGALESDLLDMKVAAQIGAPTDNYYTAIADFSSMTWDFFGPLNSPSWYTDMTSLGYDFTGPGGNMYIVLFAMPGESLHITDITLNFKDGDKPNDQKPTWWNVWGQAFDDYSTGTPHANYQVSFEDIHTHVLYTTMTSDGGRWGMNLPTGEYIFGVDGNKHLLDVSGVATEIEEIYKPGGFGIRMDLDNSGHMVYQGGNAAYTGSVVPMPLITADFF